VANEYITKCEVLEIVKGLVKYYDDVIEDLKSSV